MTSTKNNAKVLAVKTTSNDIATINNTTTSSKDTKMTKATESKATVKVETIKPVITLKDIKVANITIIEKSSCIIFQSANNIKWYLKGSTLEITTTFPAIKDRIEHFSKDKLESGRYGKIIGTIRKVNTNDDLITLLNLLATIPAKEPNAPKATKAAKEPKATPAKTETKTPAAKKTTTKKAAKAPATPAAPVTTESGIA